MRAARVFLTYAAVLGLAACTGGAGGGESSSVTPTVTPTAHPSSASSSTTSSTAASPAATPSAGPVEVPAAARAHTPAGAEAFARFYTEQMGRAFQLGSDAEMSGLYLGTCGACSAIAANAASYGRAGDHAVGTNMKVVESQVMSRARNTVLVGVLALDGPYRRVNSSGVTVKSFPQTKMSLEHSVAWRDGQWWIAKSTWRR